MELKKIFKTIINYIIAILSTIWAFFKSLFSTKKKNINERKKEINGVPLSNKPKIKISDDAGSFNTPESRNDNVITTNELKEMVTEEIIKLESEKEQVLNNSIPLNVEEAAKEILPIINEKIKKESVKDTQELKSLIREEAVKQIKTEPVMDEKLKETHKQVFEEPKKIDSINYKKVPLKDNFVLEFYDGTYALGDRFDHILTPKFKAQIVDYKDNYIKVFYQDKYYVYDFKGNLVTRDGFKDIKLYDSFYAVILNEYLLDIREYLNPNFKLSSPIPLDRMRFKTDYEIKKYISEYKIKVKSSNKVYRADTSGNIFNREIVEEPIKEESVPNPIINVPTSISPIIDTPNVEALNTPDTLFVPVEILESKKVIEENEPIISDNSTALEISVVQVPSISEERQNTENQTQEIKDSKEVETKKVKEESSEKKDNKLNEQEMYKDIELMADVVHKKSEIIISEIKKELEKEEIEDKNYDKLEQELDELLIEIDNKKRKTTNKNDLQKLNNLELRVQNIKNNLNTQKNIDLAQEKEHLESGIHTSEIYGLKMELENVYVSNKQDLNNYALQNIGDLNLLNPNDAKNIEKVLLKNELKKARNVAKISNLVLPFIRNRYFRLFVSGMLVKSHLKVYESILKRKNIEYRESNLNNMRNGNIALNGALSLTVRNINRLNYLDEATKRNFPEMEQDQEYLLYVSELKNSLTHQEEKILKKKKVINKYNLIRTGPVRELKRKRDKND